MLLSIVGCNPNDSTPDEHVHVANKEYSSDSTYHWNECSCGKWKENIREHTFGEAVFDSERHEYVSECTICKSKTYLNDHQLKGNELDYDDTHHWRGCTSCDVKLYYAPHVMSEPVYLPDTNETIKYCQNCTYTIREAAHEYDDVYYSDETHHWFLCKTCGEPGQKYSHTFGNRKPGEDPCSSVYECILCKYQTDLRYDHTWDYENGKFDPQTLQTIYTCKVEGCGETLAVSGLQDIPVADTLTADFVPSDLKVEDVIQNSKYFGYKLSMSKNADGKLILRHRDKYYYNSSVAFGDIDINESSRIPSNMSDFNYIGKVLPKDVYERDYLFKADLLPKLTIGTAIFNSDDFAQKFFNFIRFVYISTDGRLLLSFEYDTSFIYQTPNLCYAVRGRFVVEECSMNANYDTLYGLLKSNYVGPYDYSEFFSLYSNTIFNLEFLGVDDSTKGIQVGDYSYCDVNIEIPLISGVDSIFWQYIIANSQAGIDDGMYKW